jgi:radical SAM superfamily enzyme YgiQ (UPF0313 family)
MQDVDCLLVHVPKFRNYYKPINYYSSINWMSQGIWGLADALHKSDLDTKIIHLGIERVVNPDFRIESYVQSKNVNAVGFSMHFHQQISDVLENVKQLKSASPNTFVFLGGMTASHFSKQIMTRFPMVDAVITGEGEIPLTQLIQHLKQGNNDLSTVPNLVWRHGSEITENSQIYTATQEDLNQLSFSNLSYLENYQYYLEFPKAVIDTKLPMKLNYKLSKHIHAERKAIFGGLTIGRGCLVNCFYCGGGAKAQKLINHRVGVVFRSHKKVIDSILELKNYGFRGTYISFDPQPMSQTYYCELFRTIRTTGISFDIIFSAWALPSHEFLDEFKKTFDSGSSISISPETGSEKLRKSCRGIYYSNQELFSTLDYCEQLGVSTTVFFSLGVPNETYKDFQETLRLKEDIRSRYNHVKVSAFLVEMEPAAAWYTEPQKYGIKNVRHSLEDYMRDQTDPCYSPMTSIGYEKDEFFGKPVNNSKDIQNELLKLKCEHFCDSKIRCNLISAVWKITNTLRITN